MKLGIGKICSICDKEITIKDNDEGNGPYTIKNIPGFVHVKCKANFDSHIIETSHSKQRLYPEDL